MVTHPARLRQFNPALNVVSNVSLWHAEVGCMARPTEFDGMMHEVCVGMGFCGGEAAGKRTHVTDYIPSTGQVTADQFARWVLLAEGMDPAENAQTIPLKKVFLRHMGSEVVDAKSLVSGERSGS